MKHTLAIPGNQARAEEGTSQCFCNDCGRSAARAPGSCARHERLGQRGRRELRALRQHNFIRAVLREEPQHFRSHAPRVRDRPRQLHLMYHAKIFASDMIESTHVPAKKGRTLPASPFAGNKVSFQSSAETGLLKPRYCDQSRLVF